MIIYYTKHAKDKFEILKKQKFLIKKSQVEITLKNPDKIDNSKYPLIIFQKSIDKNHILRVVFVRENNDIIKVITFYPARKNKY